jgi:hypothetical protein
MWRIIVAHLFGALHKEGNSQFYYHNMAHVNREPLLELHNLLPHKMAQNEKRGETKALSS